MEDPWFRKETSKQMILPQCLSSKYRIFQEQRGGVANLDCDGDGRQGKSLGEINIYIGSQKIGGCWLGKALFKCTFFVVWNS